MKNVPVIDQRPREPGAKRRSHWSLTVPTAGVTVPAPSTAHASQYRGVGRRAVYALPSHIAGTNVLSTCWMMKPFRSEVLKPTSQSKCHGRGGGVSTFHVAAVTSFVST